MDNKIVVNASTWKEISKTFTQFYKYFTSVEILSLENSKNNESWSNTKDFDFSLNPHDFFYMRFGDKFCRIIKYRKRYTIECINFDTDLYKHFNENKLDVDFFRHLYGNFGTFEEAKNAFYEVTKTFIEFKTRFLF